MAIDQSAFTLYPNPANESVTIQHAMDVDEEVEIEIYDVTGKDGCNFILWVQEIVLLTSLVLNPAFI